MTYYFPFLPPAVINYFYYRSVTRFVNQCQAVTVALPYLKHELIRRGVTTPIYIVPIGIDTKKFIHTDREMVRKTLGFTKKDIVLMGTGRMEREKNWPFILKSFKILQRTHRHVKLVLVGSGTYLTYLERLITKMRLTKSVRIIPGVNPEEIPQYLSAADVFVYASQFETFGRVVVEAMVATLPVVTISMPWSRDIIDHGKTGILVPRRNIKLFANAIGTLIDNPQIMGDMGLTAQQYVREHFDISASWDALQEVYTKVTKE
jgi:1,2-diacylglycerol 3-alpha-glucosyltransferase